MCVSAGVNAWHATNPIYRAIYRHPMHVFWLIRSQLKLNSADVIVHANQYSARNLRDMSSALDSSTADKTINYSDHAPYSPRHLDYMARDTAQVADVGWSAP